MIKTAIRLAAAFLIGTAITGSHTATAAEKATAEKDTTHTTKYQKTFEGKKVITARGLATIHLADDKIYLEIPDSLYNRALIMGASVTSTSNPKESTVGSRPKPFTEIMFMRADSLVLLGKRSVTYTADKTDKDVIEALDVSRRPAIIASFPIIDRTPNGKCSLIDVTDFFTGDKDFLIPKDEEAYNNMGGFVVRSYKYNPKASYIKGVEATENSFSIVNEMSYNVTRKLFTMSTIAKDEPLTSTVKCTIMQTPHSSYTPMNADLKANIGRVKVIDYSSKYQGAQIKYYATRWDLSKGRQLTFVADNDFPLPYKESIKDAAKIWNKGFGREVIKIVCSDAAGNTQPKEDGKIRYIKTPASKVTSSTWVSPSTGEIFYADIVINHNVIASITTDAIISLGAANTKARSLVPDKTLFKGLLTYKIAHEMGKCLGFSANLSASSAYPADSLASGTFTNKYGITPSIMDIVGFNYIAGAAGLKEEAAMYQNRLGEYDLKALEFLYDNTPINHKDDNTPGKSFLDNTKGLTYLYVAPRGKDEKVNPYGLKGDLGDNALKSSTIAIEQLYTIVKNANEWLKDEDNDFTQRALLYDNIIERYFEYCSNVIELLNSDNRELLKNCVDWVTEKICEASRMEDLSLMNNSELNTCISEYIATALFENLMQTAVKLPDTKEEALDIINRFVLFNNLKDNVKHKIEDIYINALAKDIGIGSKSGDASANSYISYNCLTKTKKEVAKRAKKSFHYAYLNNRLEKMIK